MLKILSVPLQISTDSIPLFLTNYIANGSLYCSTYTFCSLKKCRTCIESLENNLFADHLNFIYLTAVDPDDVEQKSGVAYAINGSVIPKSMSLFKIHSKTGEIKTIKALDYEDMKEHILIIEAKDEEKNARTSLFSVVISVDDVNDHKPVFLKSDFEAEVNVNSSPGTSIIKAFAFDEDDGTNALLKFSIKGGNRNEAFYIDQNSGIIQVAKNLDPTFNKYTLQIHVSDSGSPAKTAEAQVEVSLYSVTLFKYSITGI